MDSIDAFICEKINQNKTDIEIIEEIGLNFDMNYEKAKVSYINYMSQVEMEDNTGFVRRRQLKSPSFGIIITRSNTFYKSTYRKSMICLMSSFGKVYLKHVLSK